MKSKQKKTKSSPFEKNKYEIKYHIINSLIAGSLVLLGSFVGDNFSLSLKGVALAFVVSLITALTKFKSYWDGQEKEYCNKILNFI